MTVEQEVIVLMSTVHQHMAMEERLERFRVPYRTVVKPRQLGADCGMAIRTSPQNLSKIRAISQSDGTEIYGVYIQINSVWVDYSESTESV